MKIATPDSLQVPVMIPKLMAISDRQSLGRPFDDWIRDLEGRIDALQLREKDLTDRQLLDLSSRTRQQAGRLIVIVNGRADVALASHCHGVHLPTAGVRAVLLRRRFGDRLLIGCSTHHPTEVAAAQNAGADYAIFGPVFQTPSKESYGRPVGLDALREATAHGLPVLAIGGIGPHELAAVAAAGAAGAAGIRAFQDRDHLKSMVRVASRLWPTTRETL